MSVFAAAHDDPFVALCRIGTCSQLRSALVHGHEHDWQRLRKEIRQTPPPPRGLVAHVTRLVNAELPPTSAIIAAAVMPSIPPPTGTKPKLATGYAALEQMVESQCQFRRGLCR
jgi:hypothetical protein